MRPVPVAATAAVRAAAIAAVVAFAAALVFVAAAAAQTTVLVMGGTGHPLSTPPDPLPFVQRYVQRAVDHYVGPAAGRPGTGIPAGPYNGVALITPEQDWPNYGTLPVEESVAVGAEILYGCLTGAGCAYNPDLGSAPPVPGDRFVVFGFSQSATVAQLVKNRLADAFPAGEGPDVSFVLIGAARPNGGLITRDVTGIVTLLLFGRTYGGPLTEPVRADTEYPTVNIALQYDGFSDFPLNPLNSLAVLNAYFGVLFRHLEYEQFRLDDPNVVDQGKYGDTHYFLIPAAVLPLLEPVRLLPLIGPVLADAWDPVLRVIVESAYNRALSPGVPAPLDPGYVEHPLRFAANLLGAGVAGLDNGFEAVLGVRPFGTVRPGPYGVGGDDAQPPPEPQPSPEPQPFPEAAGRQPQAAAQPAAPAGGDERVDPAPEPEAPDTVDADAVTAAGGDAPASTGTGPTGTGQRTHATAPRPAPAVRLRDGAVADRHAPPGRAERADRKPAQARPSAAVKSAS